MRKTGLIIFTVIAALGILWFQVGINQAGSFGQQAQAAPASDEQGDRETTFGGMVPGTNAQWKRGGENRGMGWMAEELAKHKVQPPFNNSHLIGKGQGATYAQVTQHDVATWARETYKEAVEGSRIFHSTDELGSEIGIACDNCHPDAANTHPETYPKYQVQLGRVALLRDMINWCIEHPVKGDMLAPDSPKMRALEAYILAQRKGEPLAYGKR
jgi:thiosulfate dehydrogenase